MFKRIKDLIYHILILVLSATIALLLPYTGKFIADNYLTYWTLIESEKAFLICVEIAVAVFLIMFCNYVVSNWKTGNSLKWRAMIWALFSQPKQKVFAYGSN
ncbi:MAG: hypothetical protein HY789_03455 [Deltaproteobacteria bacterium]|nr:hypothetical protein [Deltaproteobacteria bacterium]